jgi:hypothetical protein
MPNQSKNLNHKNSSPTNQEGIRITENQMKDFQLAQVIATSGEVQRIGHS